MNRSVKIGMPYLGKILSVNHMYGRRKDGGTYLKKEVKEWMAELGWAIVQYHIEEWKLPITIKIGGNFIDKKNCPDLHNLKPICDAIQGVTGLNDKEYKTETEKPVIDKNKTPEVVIEIKENAD